MTVWTLSAEIARDLARTFLILAAQATLLLDFLNGSDDAKHHVGGPFSYFGRFSSSAALLIKFIRWIDSDLSLYTLLANVFFPTDYLQPWRAR
jgi:hypothetical protein